MGGYGSFRRRLTRLGHIAFFGLGFVNLFYGLGDGAFESTFVEATSSASNGSRFSIGDMDSDGLPDLVLGTSAIDVRVLHNRVLR